MKNKLFTIGLALSGAVMSLGFLAPAAHAEAIPSNFVTLPVGAMADVSSGAGSLLTQFWVFVVLAVGIPLGFYIIQRAIGLVPGHRGAKRS